MDMVFGKLEGLSGIVDDTFVYGIGEAEHDQRILNVLNTARENNVRFNPDKFQFKETKHPSSVSHGLLKESDLTKTKSKQSVTCHLQRTLQSYNLSWA